MSDIGSSDEAEAYTSQNLTEEEKDSSEYSLSESKSEDDQSDDSAVADVSPSVEDCSGTTPKNFQDADSSKAGGDSESGSVVQLRRPTNFLENASADSSSEELPLRMDRLERRLRSSPIVWRDLSTVEYLANLFQLFFVAGFFLILYFMSPLIKMLLEIYVYLIGIGVINHRPFRRN